MYTPESNISEESPQLKQISINIEKMKSFPVRDDSDVKIAQYYMGLEDGIKFTRELEQNAYKANIGNTMPSILKIIDFLKARKIEVKNFEL